jgi:hypothetical protein
MREEMPSPASIYLFPAKRYGWGCGPTYHVARRLVLAAFFALVIAGVFLFPPRTALGDFLIYVIVLSHRHLWLKGEPPRWRSE